MTWLVMSVDDVSKGGKQFCSHHFWGWAVLDGGQVITLDGRRVAVVEGNTSGPLRVKQWSKGGCEMIIDRWMANGLIRWQTCIEYGGKLICGADHNKTMF